MAIRKKVKVKDLAKKYGIPATVVVKEIEAEGIALEQPGNVVPDEFLELVEHHFENFGKKKRREPQETTPAAETVTVEAEERSTPSQPVELHLKSPLTVKAVAEGLQRKPNEIVSALMKMNILANINQALEPEIAEKLCRKYGFALVVDKREKEEHQKHLGPQDDEATLEDDSRDDRPEDLVERPPVVTFLGHVDHGKTSLQDRCRQTNVVDGEAGGITQHIGASSIVHKGRAITFIDTPGHEAFTAMRARGANITDIAILVVAADDGFMPQTIEALNHARAAKVPVIVALNKMDLPSANPDKIILQMQQNLLMSEDWGGEVGTIRVSAKTGEGLDLLLDRILLESEMLELRANPKRPAQGYVLEAQLEQGLGPTASVLVTNGTLRVGDAVICNEAFGKVKSLFNEKGERIREAGPSTPVKLVGLGSVPQAGAKMAVCENERDARRIAERRSTSNREQTLSLGRVGGSLEQLFDRLSRSSRNNLKLILKTDVKGSGEAIEDSLKKLPSEKINAVIVFSGVGAITDNDVLLAAASNAVLVGFHVRVNPGVNALAKKENVEIRLYSVIYELIDDIMGALVGRLEPDKREKELGKAKILKIFSVSKGPNVCGCMVEEGLIRVGAKARVFRDKELIFNGSIHSLRRFQDDVRDVRQGLECGIKLDNFLDFQENDVIQAYEIELQKATL
jgi:translation initiation factor IF-2